ncbi:MAG TPA: hypothetical protein VMI54_28290 [Polyangiaceae bacterium]|nr:hypothetical protein [Polyangiaceae bacterium]
MGCSNGSSPSNGGSSGSAGTSSGSAGTSGDGGTGGSGAVSGGSSGEAGSTDTSGGSSASGGSSGEAGGPEGDFTGGTGGDVTGGTGGGGTGGDTTGGTGGDVTGGTGGTGGDTTGGTSGTSGTGGSKGGTPSPNVGCMGTVATGGVNKLTSCGLSVSQIAGSGQTQMTLGVQGKDANNDGLTLTLEFTDVPTATTYTFASSDYTLFDSTWNEGTDAYAATAYSGTVGIGSIKVEFDTIDGPFTLGGTTFYTVSGSISATLENPPSGSADVELTF